MIVKFKQMQIPKRFRIGFELLSITLCYIVITSEWAGKLTKSSISAHQKNAWSDNLLSF